MSDAKYVFNVFGINEFNQECDFYASIYSNFQESLHEAFYKISGDTDEWNVGVC